MKKISRVLIALVLPLCFGGCDRNQVTSTETMPSTQPAAEPLSAPVALIEGAIGSRPQAADDPEALRAQGAIFFDTQTETSEKCSGTRIFG